AAERLPRFRGIDTVKANFHHFAIGEYLDSITIDDSNNTARKISQAKGGEKQGQKHKQTRSAFHLSHLIKIDLYK
ncbi:hypothetical protein, partial [Raoultella planticola]